MTELHTHEFDLPEMDPLFVEPHAVPCRHPRLWFALAAALPVSLVLWRIAFAARVWSKSPNPLEAMG
jgi:hypothetical protein